MLWVQKFLEILIFSAIKDGQDFNGSGNGECRLAILVSFSISDTEVTRDIRNWYPLSTKDNCKYLPGNSHSAGTKKATIDKDPEIVNYGRGLAYLFSQLEVNKVWTNWDAREVGDKVQLALWQYLNDGRQNTKIRDFYCIPDGKVGEKNELYNAAKDVRNGVKKGKCSATIYILDPMVANGTTHKSLQWLLLIQKATFTEEPNIPEVNLQFKKTDMNGTAVGNAKITIAKGSNVSSIIGNTTLTSDKDGKFGSIKVKPEKNTGNFTITVKEDSLSGFYDLTDTVTLTVTYDTKTGKVTGVKSNNSHYVTETNNSTVVMVIKNERKPKVSIEFKKTDLDGNALSGAKLHIIGTENVTIDTTLTSKADGSFGSITVSPIKNNGNFKITVTETPPPGYEGLPKSVDLTVTYDQTTGTVKTITGGKDVYYTVEKDDVIEEKEFKLKDNPIELRTSNSYNRITLSDFIDKKTRHTVRSVGVDALLKPYIFCYEHGKPYHRDDNNYWSDLLVVAEFNITNDSITKYIYPSSNLYNNVKLPGNGENKVDKEYKSNDSDIVNYGKGLAYIFSQIDDSMKYMSWDIGSTPRRLDYDLCQKALWKYLQDAYDGTYNSNANEKIRNFFCIPEQSGEVGDDFTNSVYEKALEIRKGAIDGTFTSTMYLLDNRNVDSKAHNGQQWLMLVSGATYKRHEKVEEQKPALEFNGGVVTIKNKKNPQKISLRLTKTDSLTNQTLKGVVFQVTLTGAESVANYSSNASGKIIIPDVTTNDNGEIVLQDIVFNNALKEINILIEETQKPNATGFHYKDIDPIEFIATYNEENGKVSFKLLNAPSGASIEGNEIKLNIENEPLINLSGLVWLDGQTGMKNIQPANGIHDDDEKGVPGVFVQLYDVSSGKVIEEKNINTDANGHYEFLNIPKTVQGYKVLFSYDGIHYQETRYGKNLNDYGKDSKATEQERTAFNNRFKTISKDQSNDGTTLGYDYETYKEEGITKGKSTLQTTINGGNPANNEDKDNTDFRMTAQTDLTYTNTTENIDCGIVEKAFDLALGTDLISATVNVNEKSVTYNYNQILNGESEELVLEGKSSDNKKDVTYNLYLYKSDYHYRIDDYKTDIDNKVNPDDKTNKNYDGLKELEAFVKYNVVLKAQTVNESTVNKFVYYYDEIYTPYKIDGQEIDDQEIKNNNIVNYEGNTYNISIEDKENKITFTSKNDGSITSPDYRIELELEFMIDKNANGYENLTNTSYEAKNVVEIIEYSTEEGGLVDRDSAPENGITNRAISNYEDDTDESKGLHIELRKDDRIIKGTVFDDTDNDGAFNENIPVDDVIVQLIEVKKISGQYFEYIWQETRSGHDDVKTTAKDGNKGEVYTNSINEDEEEDKGKYEFIDFIPGNYIIRYIYGDGTTYNIETPQYADSAENIKKYNGQDYKSTKDVNYQEQWYDPTKYEAGQSVARDNEARRLEVMAYSIVIDEEKGKNLADKNQKALENTWMAAETSRINVPIDVGETVNTESTNVYYGNITNTIAFENMNFGLAVRPQTIFALEKHITRLTVTPNGTGVQPIVDARVNIEKLLSNNRNVTAQGVTQGLQVMKSTREERGNWYLATDVEELTDSAKLEVEYTYVIVNKGDKDYLSKTLVEAYKNQSAGKTYEDILGEVKDTVKSTMRDGTYSYTGQKIGTYLGTHYYTGEIGDDEIVPARIEAGGIEEAINNSLTFADGESGVDFEKIENVDDKNRIVFDTEGKGQKVDVTTVVQNINPTKNLTPEDDNTDLSTDLSKRIILYSTLSSVNGGEIGATIPSYIAEITKYSNAAGRRSMKDTVANSAYVHSQDNEMTLDNSWVYKVGRDTYETQEEDHIPPDATEIRKANEEDEFWGETITIGKPFGEDKLTPMQIVIITISGMAVLGVGIILIKKFALKK